MVPRPLLLCAWLGLTRTAGAHVVRGDNFAVPAAPGGCSGTAEFLGCFKDDQWDASKVKPPAKAHRALPYALPGCYDCKDGKTPDSKENPNPCKFAPNPPPCDRTKMTDDYCATLCLHWSASIPGSSGSKVWSATQFAFTFAFGLAACRVFLRRESLSAATACHCVCNYVGAPSARAFRDARAVAASALGVSLALVLLVFA